MIFYVALYGNALIHLKHDIVKRKMPIYKSAFVLTTSSYTANPNTVVHKDKLFTISVESEHSLSRFQNQKGGLDE